MKIIDLNEFEDGDTIETDLCIAGSGPSGASIALEFAGSKVQVLIIEGGGIEQTSADRAIYDVENVGVARTTPQDLVRNRVIGGSSHSWSGRCASFDDIDFVSRPWISNSGWPITPNDIRPFLDRSRKYLGIGPNIYDERLWDQLGAPSPRPRFDPSKLKSQFWQYSRHERNSVEPTRFSRKLAEITAPNVSLLMHANVTRVNMREDGACVESLEVRSHEGRRAEVKAKITVLACGALENARLLLASNKIVQTGVGNSHDLVGRFLMDHPGCSVGWFDPHRSASIQSRFGRYELDHEDGKNIYTFGLMLSPEVQKKEQLLNCAAFLEQGPSTDESWNALVRLARPGDEKCRTNTIRDASTVIGNLPKLLGNAYRRVARRQEPILSIDNLSLYCLVEQTPDPSSRVTLAKSMDALGMPILRVDWRIGELERKSVTRLSGLIALELRRTGLPKYFPNTKLFEDIDWRSQFVDRAHPSGTTRMSDSPRQGVVDRNCKVHDVRGLYIAGSSVFPTAGHANPTLMIVAFSVRLADWLKRQEFAYE